MPLSASLANEREQTRRRGWKQKFAVESSFQKAKVDCTPPPPPLAVLCLLLTVISVSDPLPPPTMPSPPYIVKSPTGETYLVQTDTSYMKCACARCDLVKTCKPGPTWYQNHVLKANRKCGANQPIKDIAELPDGYMYVELQDIQGWQPVHANPPAAATSSEAAAAATSSDAAAPAAPAVPAAAAAPLSKEQKKSLVDQIGAHSVPELAKYVGKPMKKGETNKWRKVDWVKVALEKHLSDRKNRVDFCLSDD